MSEQIRVLIVEDSIGDTDLDVMALESGGFDVEFRRVETEEGFREALDDFEPEVVLSDHSMPRFDAERALKMLKVLRPHVPFIVVSGQIGEVAAVNLMRAGACDYVVKDSLARLAPAVRRELQESRLGKRGLTAERQLAEYQRMLERLMNHLPGAVYRLQREDGEWHFDFASLGFDELIGVHPDKLMGDDGLAMSELIYPEDRDGVLDAFRRAFAEDSTCTVEHRMQHADGEVKWVWNRASAERDSEGRLIGVEGFVADITERKLSQAKLDYLAHHDTLTGLANRCHFEQQMTRAIARADRHRTRLALLFIDLDGFKDINDSWGHPVGDALLRATAERLVDDKRAFDLVARLGGDEFVLVVDDFLSESDLSRVAGKILEDLSRPFKLDGNEFRMSASIGLALYPNDGKEVSSLLQNADAAMYQAKEAGRNTYRYFTTAMNERARDLVALRTAIPKAIQDNEFELEFQPQVSLADGKMDCVEALLRWNHPQEGRLGAGRFIEAAEETGSVSEIDAWVIRQVCCQARLWADSGVHYGRLAFNLSARSLRLKNLPDIVRKSLVEYGVDGRMLELEITETGMMQDMNTALGNLREIEELGICITLDDFGKGYSSLNYLKRFPISRLKIDRDFVKDLPQSQSDLQICRAIVALASSLDIDVVAEGIETAEQRQLLLDIGCHIGQGYFLHRPMRLADCVKVLQST